MFNIFFFKNLLKNRVDVYLDIRISLLINHYRIFFKRYLMLENSPQQRQQQPWQLKIQTISKFTWKLSMVSNYSALDSIVSEHTSNIWGERDYFNEYWNPLFIIVKWGHLYLQDMGKKSVKCLQLLSTNCYVDQAKPIYTPKIMFQ